MDSNPSTAYKMSHRRWAYVGPSNPLAMTLNRDLLNLYWWQVTALSIPLNRVLLSQADEVCCWAI